MGALVIPLGLGDTPPPAWYVNWDPTSGITALGLRPAYAINLGPAITNEAQLQQFVLTLENKVPDLAGWFASHLLLAGLSLVRRIATLLEPSEGRILWNGKDIRAHGEVLRQVLGYLPQDFGIHPEFTGRQFLRHLAAMKGLPRALAYRRVDEVMEIVNLE